MRIAIIIASLFSFAAIAQTNCVDYDAGCVVGAIRVGDAGTLFVEDPTATGDLYVSLSKSGFVAVAGLGTGSHLGLYNGHHQGLVLTYWDQFIPGNDRFWDLGTLQYSWAETSSYSYVTKPDSVVCSAGAGQCSAVSSQVSANSVLHPASGSIRFDCQDSDGCQWSPNVDGGIDGQAMCMTNVGDNSVLVKDAPGSVELEGGFLGSKYSNICLEFIGDRWVEKSRRNP